MRFLIAALVLFITVPTLGQERAPSWDDPQAVPDPIPSNICIEVHWTEKSRTWHEGEAVAFMHPPLSEKELRALEQVRSEGKAILIRCSLGKS